MVFEKPSYVGVKCPQCVTKKSEMKEELQPPHFMPFETERQMWMKVYQSMLEVPNIAQSDYFKQYFVEVAERVRRFEPSKACTGRIKKPETQISRFGRVGFKTHPKILK